jgi:UDP-glucose 4-epimerase
MVKAFEKAADVQIPYQIIDKRPGDVAVCYADPNKAKSELGWIAEKNISDMCVDSWRWQKANPNGYNNKG